MQTKLQRITAKYRPIARTKFSKLPPEVRPIFTTGSAQGVIDNGGLPFLFEGDWPEMSDWRIFADDYEAIGFAEAAKAFRSALALFPGGQPQRSLEERRTFIFDTLGGEDGELGRLSDVIMGKSKLLDQLLTRYIEEHEIA